MNDANYVLGESFEAFNEIHDLSQELELGSGSLDEESRQQKQEKLESAQNKAKSYMQLTNESVATLKLFTDALADAFTSPEIVQRLADMLGYNLELLVGPRSKNLKVKNPDEYGFYPRTLLSDLMDVFLNLSGKSNFHLAIARDTRSYKPSNFDQAAGIMTRFGLKSPEELKRWKRLKETVNRAKEEDDAEEEDLDDVPDEFVDPWMATIMTDPVILPTSEFVLDRSTIRQHLLSDPRDPLNRSPLKIEDVIDNTKLKERIDAFRAEKRKARMNKMDTSDG